MGVWIEIIEILAGKIVLKVTPWVGVWIEIHWCICPICISEVTPCVGVWIEILLSNVLTKNAGCHSLGGSVD